MRILSFLAMMLMLTECKVPESKTGEKSDVMPASLQGFYCPEGMKGDDCPPLIIEAKSVFDTAMGGCTKISKVIRTDKTYTVRCEEGEPVSVEVISGNRISLRVGKFKEVREMHKK